MTITHRLWLVLVLTALIHLINTLGYSVRLAGVRTQRLALAFSLWNVIFLISSTANTIQAPLMGKIIDRAGAMVAVNRQEVLLAVSREMRLVLLAATVGTILGTIMIPSFVRIFTKGIFLFERVGSVPGMVKMLLSPQKIKSLLGAVRLPGKKQIAHISRQKVPKRIVVLNILVTGIYTTGVLSALYAGLMDINHVRTATNMTGIINGLATVLGVTVIDPKVASITDQAARGLRAEADVKDMTVYLALSRIGGTILAQAIFFPAAWFIVQVAKLI